MAISVKDLPLLELSMEAIADLYYISEYAQILQGQLKDGEQPNQVLLNRMLALAEKVQRQYDPSYEEWCDAESRR